MRGCSPPNLRSWQPGKFSSLVVLDTWERPSFKHCAPGREILGLDVLASPFTDHVGSNADRNVVRECVEGAEAVLHTATLHKPHVRNHAVRRYRSERDRDHDSVGRGRRSGRDRFVFTSTTSAFGRALVPSPGSPQHGSLRTSFPIPKNIYGVTKTAAEDVCELAAREEGLPVVVLRTSGSSRKQMTTPPSPLRSSTGNIKANEYLYRRVDIEDVVSAHLLAEDLAPVSGLPSTSSAPPPRSPVKMQRNWPEMPRASFAPLS